MLAFAGRKASTLKTQAQLKGSLDGQTTGYQIDREAASDKSNGARKGVRKDA